MTTSTQLFADRILNLAVTGPLVRLELGVAQLTEGGDKPVNYLPTQTLVMPLEGFVESFGMLEHAMKKLAESGLVKARVEAKPPQSAN